MTKKRAKKREIAILSDECLNKMLEEVLNDDLPEERKEIPICLSEKKLNEMLLAFEEESNI